MENMKDTSVFLLFLSAGDSESKLAWHELQALHLTLLELREEELVTAVWSGLYTLLEGRGLEIRLKNPEKYGEEKLRNVRVRWNLYLNFELGF